MENLTVVLESGGVVDQDIVLLVYYLVRRTRWEIFVGCIEV